MKSTGKFMGCILWEIDKSTTSSNQQLFKPDITLQTTKIWKLKMTNFHTRKISPKNLNSTGLDIQKWKMYNSQEMLKYNCQQIL